MNRHQAAQRFALLSAALAIPALQPAGAVSPSGPPTKAQWEQTRLSPQAQRVTDALRHALESRISSPGRSIQIRVTPTARADQGYFSEVYVSGEPAQIKTMRISALTMRANDVRIDVAALLQRGKVNTISSNTHLRATVTEDDLTQLLAQGKSTRPMNLRVKYLGEDGSVRVSGRWNWSWFNGPVVGVGRLRLLPGYKVNFDIVSLQLNGVEVPQFVKDRFSQRLNPVIKYEDLPFRPHFQALRVVGSRAVLMA